MSLSLDGKDVFFGLLRHGGGGSFCEVRKMGKEREVREEGEKMREGRDVATRGEQEKGQQPPQCFRGTLERAKVLTKVL